MSEYLSSLQSYKLNYVPGMQAYTKQALYQIQKHNLNKPKTFEKINLNEEFSGQENSATGNTL